MSPSKNDFLRVCNTQNLPFQEFTETWCSRCYQRECSRSQHGKSKFEERAESWQKRLFTEVPRMDPTDPQYQKLASQRFLDISVGGQAASGWVDPLQSSTEVQSVPAIPPPQNEAIQPTVPQNSVSVDNPTKFSGTPRFVESNTPNKSRQMIGEAPSAPAAPVLDPWQPTQPLKPGEVLVGKGAKIKFGK